MKPSLRRLFATLVSLTLLAPWTFGQSHEPKTWFEEQGRYLELDLSQQDVEELARAFDDTTDPTLDEEGRQEALKLLLGTMIEKQGVSDAYPAGPPPQLLSRASEFAGLEAPASPLPVEVSTKPLAAILQKGDGPIPVILIGGNLPAELSFGEFLDQPGEDYSIYAVSLPGIGGAPSLPLPAKRDWKQASWLRSIGDGVLNLSNERKLERPVLIGHDIGAWVALDLASRHPKSFRSAILVDPTRLSPPISRRGPGYAQLEERRDAGRALLPSFLPPPSPEIRQASLAPLAGGYAQDPKIIGPVLQAWLATHPDVTQRYQQEIASFDRSAALGRLKLPTLMILSLQDEQSALWGGPFLNLGSWMEDLLANEGTPFTVARFDDIRQPFLDRPDALRQAMNDFLAGREMTPTGRDPERNFRHASSWRHVAANLALTDISIDYYAPRARERELWGQVVPWDQVWRTGANEATRIHFSHDVRIGGQKLKAGEYSIFLIPKAEGPWTLIFNRIAYQWGSFAYDSRHDALRLEIEPETMDSWKDVLTFDIAEETVGRGELVLAWGSRALRAEVLALHGLQWVPAVEPSRFERFGEWLELSSDLAGDAVNGPPVHDGESLAAAYECATDQVWFRFGFASPFSRQQLGLNIAVDTDRDLTTGTPWWASNRGATFDRLVTLWVEGSDEHGFVGDIGLASSEEVMMGAFAARPGGLEFGVDREKHRLYLGVTAKDLDDDGELALVATVGTDSNWTDDLIDEGQADLSIQALRAKACGN